MEIFCDYFNKVLDLKDVTPPPPPPSAPPPQAAPALEVGQFVLIHSLLNRPELNHLEGIGQAILPNGRVQVKLCTGVVASISLQNLTQIPQPPKAWTCRACQKNAYWSEGAGP